MKGKLTQAFREMIELKWSEFVALEQDDSETNFTSAICTIIRACKKGNLRAIQTALDRLDGKIAAEIEVEYPKFYYLYPNATKTADDPQIIEADENGEIKGVIPNVTLTGVNSISIIDVTGSPADLDEQSASDEELPTGSLRAVLQRMLDSPKSIVDQLLAAADQIDEGGTIYGNPSVKSVMIAGLMKMVHDGKMNAVFEVFDQIDGKVADKLKVLGNDVYIKRFETIAPAGAVKNDDGIYQVVADNTTDTWVARLEQSKGKR